MRPLREAREAIGMSQSDFATLLEISPRWLRRLESDARAVRNLRGSTRGRLTYVLGLDREAARRELQVARARLDGLTLTDGRARSLYDFSDLYGGSMREMDGSMTKIPDGTKWFVLTATNPFTGLVGDQVCDLILGLLKHNDRTRWCYLRPLETNWIPDSRDGDPPGTGQLGLRRLVSGFAEELAGISSISRRLREFLGDDEQWSKLKDRFQVMPIPFSHFFSPISRIIFMVFPLGEGARTASPRAWIELSYDGYKRPPAVIELNAAETESVHNWLRVCDVNVRPRGK